MFFKNWSILLRFNFIAVILGLLSFFIFSSAVYASVVSDSSNPLLLENASTFNMNTDIVSFPTQSNVPTNKVWTITLTQELDLTKKLANYISVTDSQNTSINISAAFGSDGKSITVNPPQGGYPTGGTYSLIIAQGLVSNSGKLTNKLYMMKFSVTGETTQNYVITATSSSSSFGSLVTVSLDSANPLSVTQFQVFATDGITVNSNKTNLGTATMVFPPKVSGQQVIVKLFDATGAQVGNSQTVTLT